MHPARHRLCFRRRVVHFGSERHLARVCYASVSSSRRLLTFAREVGRLSMLWVGGAHVTAGT